LRSEIISKEGGPPKGNKSDEKPAASMKHSGVDIFARMKQAPKEE
jgi:hypothetical protein